MLANPRMLADPEVPFPTRDRPQGEARYEGSGRRGKEGVSGSSPEEGFTEAPANRHGCPGRTRLSRAALAPGGEPKGDGLPVG